MKGVEGAGMVLVVGVIAFLVFRLGRPAVEKIKGLLKKK